MSKPLATRDGEVFTKCIQVQNETMLRHTPESTLEHLGAVGPILIVSDTMIDFKTLSRPALSVVILSRGGRKRTPIWEAGET